MNYEDDNRTNYESHDTLSLEESLQLRERVLKVLNDIPDPKTTMGRNGPISNPFFGLSPSGDHRITRARRFSRHPPGGQGGYIWEITVGREENQMVAVSPSGEATVTVNRCYIVRDHELPPGEHPVTRIVGTDRNREVPVTTTDESILENNIQWAGEDLKRERTESAGERSEDSAK